MVYRLYCPFRSTDPPQHGILRDDSTYEALVFTLCLVLPPCRSTDPPQYGIRRDDAASEALLFTERDRLRPIAADSQRQAKAGSGANGKGGQMVVPEQVGKVCGGSGVLRAADQRGPQPAGQPQTRVA